MHSKNEKFLALFSSFLFLFFYYRQLGRRSGFEKWRKENDFLNNRTFIFLEKRKRTLKRKGLSVLGNVFPGRGFFLFFFFFFCRRPNKNFLCPKIEDWGQRGERVVRRLAQLKRNEFCNRVPKIFSEFLAFKRDFVPWLKSVDGCLLSVGR